MQSTLGDHKYIRTNVKVATVRGSDLYIGDPQNTKIDRNDKESEVRINLAA